MAGNTFVCADCLRLGFDASTPMGKSKDEIEGTIGTNFARFRTYTEFAWHVKNIHGRDLRRTEAGRNGQSVTNLAECDCFSGLWG